jgi:hypothetical protein
MNSRVHACSVCYCAWGYVDRLWLESVCVMIASSKRGLVPLACCSVINTFLWCSACIYNVSQQSICIPFWHAYNNCSVSSSVPYSCLLSNIWVACADFGLFIRIYFICSLNLTFMALPDCPAYVPLHVLHFNEHVLSDHNYPQVNQSTLSQNIFLISN